MLFSSASIIFLLYRGHARNSDATRKILSKHMGKKPFHTEDDSINCWQRSREAVGFKPWRCINLKLTKPRTIFPELYQMTSVAESRTGAQYPVMYPRKYPRKSEHLLSGIYSIKHISQKNKYF